MVYIYLPAVCYHLNLDRKESLLASGIFCCPSSLSCLSFFLNVNW